MEYCHLRQEGRQYQMRGVATVMYSNQQWAAYAKEKFHGFEYPIGSRLIVRPEYDNSGQFGNRNSPQDITLPNQTDIKQLAETIAQATTLIQAAGLSPGVYF